MGSNAAPAVPRLRPLLAAKHTNLPNRAARVLKAIGPPAAEAVPDLIRTFREEEVSSYSATEALGAIGPTAVEPLRAVLRSAPSKSSEEAWACRALGRVGSAAATALPELRPRMTSDNEVRVRAAVLIGALGPAGAPAVADLAEVVRGDPSAEVRGRAVRALRKIGPAAVPAVPAIRDALAGLHERDRLDAALTICELGRDSQPLADWVQKELAGKGFGPGGFPQPVREAVVRLGPDARPLVPALEEAYRQGSLYQEELVSLLAPVDRFRAFRYDGAAHFVAVGFLMLACIPVEVFLRWRTRGQKPTHRSEPPSAPTNPFDNPAAA